ncbi:hypothetical protein [Chryseobacterium sp. ISL-6]|uniref:hypothetical protein n=1 Tax=Chryseobacterium sp. ISL-6 TaxID=2819143 RepID=UPI001BE9F545|nr:hypothetical protein [Chryseobacterium sp. ISL-6]MBT2623743.1 hypothetical protein [Chryseobacterium sp. ISL-6]
MIEKLKYYPVHWMDGMKINKNHFTDVQNFVSDSVRDSIGSTTSPINYGLLPVSDSIKIRLTVDQHRQLKIIIEKCHGVTPNGSRIDIDIPDEGFSEQSFLYPEASYMIKEDENVNLMVCLSVNIFKRIPFGEPDQEENPPRYPYTRPEYLLQLIPERELKDPLGFGAGHLVVARILVNAGKCEIDTHYIPASQSVYSHKSLKEFYVEIDHFYGQIELYASHIKQKIRSKKQNNLLSLIVDDMADKTLSYLGMEINRYRWTAPYSPPIYILSSVSAFARVLKNCIETYTGSGKEELLNYLTEWCNISQGDFESVFSEILNADYNHNQINQIIVKAKQFITTAEEMFSILYQLDYIGKKRDGSIFISESPGDKDAAIHIKRSQSFLAD